MSKLKELYKLFTSDQVERIYFCKFELGYKRTIHSVTPYSVTFSELEDYLKHECSIIEVVLKDEKISRVF
mgnify:CR=1 FL=1|tara:strand:+ start:1080 stop:1289 length:210 start_codon:yes stop_codon:yes gene_type:complete